LQNWIESRGIDENPLVYLMISVKAKLDWLPYGNKIEDNVLSHNLDYNKIMYKVPLISDMTGYYK